MRIDGRHRPGDSSFMCSDSIRSSFLVSKKISGAGCLGGRYTGG